MIAGKMRCALAIRLWWRVIVSFCAGLRRQLATCLRTLADVLRYEVGQARALLDAGFGKRWNTLRRKVALNFRTEMNAALRKRCIAQLQSASSPPAAPCALRERSS
eukprot:649619-Pleurochrysis_carterae.AAC.1